MDLPERLACEPGAAELVELAPPGAFLVGGAVRDLLLGRGPRELDVVLAGAGGGAAPDGAVSRLARALAERLGGRHAEEHPRFDTAVVEWAGGRIDVAAARRERYPEPGALPEVEPAPLAEDLLRRDFTANAIAVGLLGEERGAVLTAPHALEDLHARRLRVLHERSFLDDPTRLWRMVRYRARLGFAVEPHTAELAARAVAADALATVSGARLGAELRLALAEPDPLAALAEADRLGLLGALHPRLRFEAQLLGRALELLDADRGRARARPAGPARSDSDPDRLDGRSARPDALILASLLLALTLRADAPREDDRAVEAAALLDRLEFAAPVRDRVVAAALAAPRLIDALGRPLRPSELRAAVGHAPPEGVALAGALSAPAADAARQWLGELRHVHLRIDGNDLLAGGIPEGPEVGRRLEATLCRTLDGELPDDRDAQLRAALAECRRTAQGRT